MIFEPDLEQRLSAMAAGSTDPLHDLLGNLAAGMLAMAATIEQINETLDGSPIDMAAVVQLWTEQKD